MNEERPEIRDMFFIKLGLRCFPGKDWVREEGETKIKVERRQSNRKDK